MLTRTTWCPHESVIPYIAPMEEAGWQVRTLVPLKQQTEKGGPLVSGLVIVMEQADG